MCPPNSKFARDGGVGIVREERTNGRYEIATGVAVGTTVVIGADLTVTVLTRNETSKKMTSPPDKAVGIFFQIARTLCNT
jgi:hypothetical protein